MTTTLPRQFYLRKADVVARALLGKILVHGSTAGRIVETEAYLGMDDLAAHASRGVTDRTRVIFGPPGHAYIYLIYGMYECLNIVCEPEGHAGCVLLRALEPVRGVELMQERRPAARRVQDLASGPGRLTRALAVTRALNGTDVTRGPLTVQEPQDTEPFIVKATPRVGISQCKDWPLRFIVEGSPSVSRDPGIRVTRKRVNQ